MSALSIESCVSYHFRFSKPIGRNILQTIWNFIIFWGFAEGFWLVQHDFVFHFQFVAFIIVELLIFNAPIWCLNHMVLHNVHICKWVSNCKDILHFCSYHHRPRTLYSSLLHYEQQLWAWSRRITSSIEELLRFTARKAYKAYFNARFTKKEQWFSDAQKPVYNSKINQYSNQFL